MKNTTLCYIEKDGCYLMMHRTKKDRDVNHDKWVGVGGKFEEGETDEDCLLREVREETGLRLTSYKKRGIVTFLSDEWEGEYMHLYTADGFEGEPFSSNDCAEGELCWIPKRDVYRLPVWQGDLLFFKELEENEDFFTMLLRYEGDRLVGYEKNGVALDVKSQLFQTGKQLDI